MVSELDASIRVIDVAVALDGFWRGFVREVRGVEARIQEHRPRGVSRLDQVYGFVGNEMGAVAFFSERLSVALPVQTAALYVIPIANATREVAVEVIESS